MTEQVKAIKLKWLAIVREETATVYAKYDKLMAQTALPSERYKLVQKREKELQSLRERINKKGLDEISKLPEQP